MSLRDLEILEDEIEESRTALAITKGLIAEQVIGGLSYDKKLVNTARALKLKIESLSIDFENEVIRSAQIATLNDEDEEDGTED